MDVFFQKVRAAADQGLYFLALAGALMIPDLCGALESPDGESSGVRYKAWFDRHLTPRYTYGRRVSLDGETAWRFRCSFLHQGHTQHALSRYARVIFIEPGTGGITAHMNVLNDALDIDVRTFCHEVVDAANAWRNSVVGTEPYETNLTSFVTRYPNGLRPYTCGVPVIR